ncbi:motility protein A [Bdellovibrio bacteriovorus]|nr:MotA/TolQ/ExbB proton channel family protein [Bdellovibrio bacteriovorus]
MNFSSALGVIAAIVVFGVAIFTSTSSREIFLDPHGILIVIGGTMAAAFLCFPVSTFPQMVKVVIRKFLGKYGHRHANAIREIVEMSKTQKEDAQLFREKIPQIKTDFLRDGLKLLVDGGMNDKQLDAILKKRADVQFRRHQKEANIFKTLAKFPPAFGLMGTTIGMIALLQSLGSADAYSRLGPAMAIGLVATLYGIALANFVFIPLGENLAKLNEEDELLRELVIDGIRLLRAQEHPLVVEEFLVSYLNPTERHKLQAKAS